MKKLSLYIILVLFCFNAEAKAEKNVKWQVFVKLKGEMGNNSNLPGFNAKETSKIKSAKDQKKIVKKTIDKALHKCENSNVKWTISLRGNKICTVTVVKYFDEDNPENNNKYVNLSGIKFDDLIISINGLEKLTPEKIEEIAVVQKKLSEEKVTNTKNMCDVSKSMNKWSMCIGTELDPSNNGYKYVGEFKNGEKHGQGTETFADGYKYVGEFKNGEKHGQGTATFANGKKKSGLWKQGGILTKKEVKAAKNVKDDSYLFYNGMYRDCDILIKNDPTTFKSISFSKEKKVKAWDSRTNNSSGWEKSSFKAFIFKATYEEGRKINIQVNSEFETKDKAEKQALRYGKMLGQLPIFLRNKNLKTITIHKSKLSWTAGFKDIEINIGQTVNRLECEAELLMHESAHVELDWRHKGTVKSSKWKKAAIADNKYISDYAREFSEKEDVAETINWWIAVRCKTDRISKKDYRMIVKAIPNRLKYLDEQKYDMHPLVCS